jgi:DNA-binding NarL/FixJ family response regulator
LTILLVDDHVLIREAMRGVLRELDGSTPILEAQSARQADELISRNPDISLVLLDLGLPDRDGFEMLASLRQSHPAIAVVVLSALNDRDNVRKSLDAGAQGFIPKTSGREILLGALRLILAGGVYIPPEILSGAPEPRAASPSATADRAGSTCLP